MKNIINPKFEIHSNALNQIIANFDYEGEMFGDGNRNKIKLFDLESIKINIKSFKIPSFFNKIIYKYFRESKAKRSFDFANKLIQNGFNTPEPIAFYEEMLFSGLKKSYYISEHLDFDFMFRDLVENPEKFDFENILRQFTVFCFDLHEKGVEFLDHSPGNTLIKKSVSGNYHFYLVDLNRMKFHKSMSFDSRMNNLKRLVIKKEMTDLMSNEYSKLYNKSESEISSKLWALTTEFQDAYYRKKRLKKKLKFWKN
jgi:Lipopolysaccharide kinase (Kdo/WaaP) family